MFSEDNGDEFKYSATTAATTITTEKKTKKKRRGRGQRREEEEERKDIDQHNLSLLRVSRLLQHTLHVAVVSKRH